MYYFLLDLVLIILVWQSSDNILLPPIYLCFYDYLSMWESPYPSLYPSSSLYAPLISFLKILWFFPRLPFNLICSYSHYNITVGCFKYFSIHLVDAPIMLVASFPFDCLAFCSSFLVPSIFSLIWLFLKSWLLLRLNRYQNFHWYVIEICIYMGNLYLKKYNL